MEPVFAMLEAWWWIAPTAVGLGAVSYGALTTGRRRARRLEVDAARHEVAAAQAAIVSARADVRTAQARMLTAQADTAPWMPAFLSTPDAHREVLAAKRAERAAQMTLRAKRIAVSAARARMNAAGGAASATPLTALCARHDAVTARWLDYETDVALLIAYPQMTDARHPSTAAYLLAQREALRLRPPTTQVRVSPADFVAYRESVVRVEEAFAAAETSARRSVSRG